jgi:hypothetical protein
MSHYGQCLSRQGTSLLNFLSQTGDYAYGCSHIPSLAICNLFVRQLLDNGVEENAIFASDSTRITAGVGVLPSCQILSVHANHSVGNVANIVVCGLSVVVALALAWRSVRRVAA